MNNPMKGILVAGILSSASIFSYGLLVTAPVAKQVKAEIVAVAIRTTQIRKQQIRLKVRSQGIVAPKTETALVPEVSGRVQWISPKLVAGGYFALDELLIKIDDRDLSAAVDRSHAALSRARAESDYSRFELRRLSSLVKQQLISQSSLGSSERAARVTHAAVIEAEVSLAQAQRDLQRTEIRAPYKGLVRNKSVDLGQYISRGNAIATIYASESVEVRLPLADSQLAYLDLPLGYRGELPEENQAVVMLSTHYGGEYYEWRGKLVRTEAEIDTRTRMVMAVVRIPNSVGENSDTQNSDTQNKEVTRVPLPVGLFVHAEIQGRLAKDVVVLPRAALRNQSRVLIVDANNRLRYREVDLLRFDGDEVIISAGLNDGDRVNLTPLQTVADGMLVNPITTPATKPAKHAGRY